MKYISQIFTDIAKAWREIPQARFNIIADIILGAAIVITLAGSWRKVLGK